MVVADDDGVVCVPADRWAQVQEAGRVVEATEAAIRMDLVQGRTLADARESHGYHALRPGHRGPRD
jgi:regulator of RNase E activity RraA